ncbi:MAG: TonB-dependent receptor [Flavobacteriales bacterium]|nr:TonB-dependent receptor [Flavobacteriales bacterium]
MRISLLIIGLIISSGLFSQSLTQTIRGTVFDRESESTLPGANVILLTTNSAKGVSSDINGDFELTEVPIGRHALKITFLGYEDVVLPNVLVGSAKEVIIRVSLVESLVNIKEVVITGGPKNNEANNDMATVSARSFTMEEASRYAASLDDPARMALSLAGVNSDDDILNEIVVRGNSPRGSLWRLNGIEIPSPNHFTDVGASGGGISVFSNNMIDNSDFFTAAFPAEYGNATSGVFDINLRKGNQHKAERAFQFGLLGTDVSAEGPISGPNKGSYLINYRYSTLGMLTGLGILDFDDNNLFQDLSFNFFLPTEKYGNFGLFGIGGLSLSEEFTPDDTSDFEDGEDYYDSQFTSDMGVVGLEHKYFFNSGTYLKTVVAVTAQRIGFEVDSISPVNLKEIRLYQEQINNTDVRVSTYLNKKMNARNTFRGGVIASRKFFDLFSSGRDDDDQQYKDFLRNDGSADVLQAYGQWKYKFHEDWTLNGGLHGLYFQLNNNYSIEPRVGLSWKFTEGQSLSFGAGMHSRLEGMSAYMAQQQRADGSYFQPNKDLDLTKSIHYVIGYDRMLNEHLHLKTELYYQSLFDVPVENDITSPNSALNSSSGFTTDDLVNRGTAYNVGAEITFERFFNEGAYYMITGSIFDSKYKTLDGNTYNGRYNANYRFTLLGGKEYKVGKSKKNLLGMNLKGILSGGNRYTEIDLEASKLAQEEVTIEGKEFAESVPDYWRLDLTSSYRINREKVAHIISLQVQNVTNRENIFGYSYDDDTQKIEEELQFGLLPILKYRIEF